MAAKEAPNGADVEPTAVSGSEERAPIGEVLHGLGIHALDADFSPTFAFVLIKGVEDGEVTWAYRTTGVPNREELLGALMVHCDLLRSELLSAWQDE